MACGIGQAVVQIDDQRLAWLLQPCLELEDREPVHLRQVLAAENPPPFPPRSPPSSWPGSCSHALSSKTGSQSTCARFSPPRILGPCQPRRSAAPAACSPSRSTSTSLQPICSSHEAVTRARTPLSSTSTRQALRTPT